MVKSKKQKPVEVTVIDDPITSSKVPLEEITSRTEVTLEFYEPVDPQQVQHNLALYKNKEVYVQEAGSENLIHGTLIPITQVINCYGLMYYKGPEMPDFHKYKDLRVIKIIRRRQS